MNDLFTRVARREAAILGSAGAFIVATVVVLIRAASLPFFHDADTWLVISTGATVVPFFVVFIVQNSQDRASKAARFKLDKLIRAQEGDRNRLIGLEGSDDAEMTALEVEFLRIREPAHRTQNPSVPALAFQL